MLWCGPKMQAGNGRGGQQRSYTKGKEANCHAHRQRRWKLSELARTHVRTTSTNRLSRLRTKSREVAAGRRLRRPIREIAHAVLLVEALAQERPGLLNSKQRAAVTLTLGLIRDLVLPDKAAKLAYPTWHSLF